jgi:hypothetical protein
VIIDTRNPAQPTIISSFLDTTNQRLAPDGPVHDDRRERPRARVRHRRGRVRRRARPYRTEGGESWAAKTPSIERSGSFYLHSNDIERGLDIIRFSATAPASAKQGKWMSPAQAKAYFAGLPKVPVTSENALVCLLPGS